MWINYPYKGCFVFWALGLSVFVSGCSNQDLPGQIWEVTVMATEEFGEDTCNDPPIGYKETFNYRVVFDGAAASLNIGEEAFAGGVLEGCVLLYETVVWAEQRDEGTLRWKLKGSASIYSGGETCLLADDRDWEGDETIEIIYSDIPSIAAGCTYTMDTIGVYIGEGEN